MPAAMMHEKIQRRSPAAGQPAPSQSQPPVYHSKTARKNDLSSKDHFSSKLTLPEHHLNLALQIQVSTIGANIIPAQILRTALNTRLLPA